MSIAAGLTLMGRAQAEALMESTCVITRQGVPTQNIDGSTSPNATTIYTGPCRLRFPTATAVRAVDVLVEGQSIVHAKGVLSLPINGSSGVRASDTAVVTLSPTLDPGTTVTVRIEAPFTQTHSTARRFPCEVSN